MVWAGIGVTDLTTKNAFIFFLFVKIISICHGKGQMAALG